MLERFKRYAWKAYVLHKGTGGSNPFLSAKNTAFKLCFFMYYLYILKSEKFDKYYIGQTNDIQDRLRIPKQVLKISFPGTEPGS